jgi:hypothetical protein
MRTDHTSVQLIPIMAMLVAFAWSMVGTGPVQAGDPFPLPTNYAATSPADVEAD